MRHDLSIKSDSCVLIDGAQIGFTVIPKLKTGLNAVAIRKTRVSAEEETGLGVRLKRSNTPQGDIAYRTSINASAFLFDHIGNPLLQFKYREIGFLIASNAKLEAVRIPSLLGLMKSQPWAVQIEGGNGVTGNGS